MHQNGDGQEKAADHDKGTDSVGIGHGDQAAAHGDDDHDDSADGQSRAMGHLNVTGRAKQHQNVGGGLQLGGQHAHIGQHDAQGGNDTGYGTITGTHDLRHGYLV